MTLFLDDGSLVIQKNDNKNSIYLFPRIYLYTQSFSKEENILLMNHLKKEFNVINVNFKLKWTSNGPNWHLEINKRNDINYFISLIKPFPKNIKCMNYKVNLEKRLNDEKIKLEKITKK